MATRNSNTKTATKSTGRRPGRPSNADRQKRVMSQQEQIVDMTMAVASAAVKTALGIVTDGGVQTIGVPQGSQTQSAGTSTGSQSQTSTITKTGGTSTPTATTATGAARKKPGRRVDKGSAMSKAREFYANNTDMERSEMVNTLHQKLGISKQVANTYVSNIDKAHGYKLSSRRGRSRGASTQQDNQQSNAA